VPALQVRQGVCQRSAAPRQRRRTGGPIGPATVADHIVPWPLRALEAWFNGDLRALTACGLFGDKMPGMVEAADLETMVTV
jgi:hypothetical protein